MLYICSVTGQSDVISDDIRSRLVAQSEPQHDVCTAITINTHFQPRRRLLSGIQHKLSSVLCWVVEGGGPAGYAVMRRCKTDKWCDQSLVRERESLDTLAGTVGTSPPLEPISQVE